MHHSYRSTVNKVAGPKLQSYQFPNDVALFVIGDAHGQNLALRNLLSDIGRLPTPGKRRIVVFLGDLIDRGPDSLDCLKAAYEDAAELTKATEVVYLPGNHELLMADAIDHAHKDEAAFNDRFGPANCWLNNGGMTFLIDACQANNIEMPKEGHEAVKLLSNLLPHPGYDSFAAKVRAMPSHYRIGDVLCVHAGIAPKHPFEYTLGLTQRDHFPLSHAVHDVSDRHWAWIRNRFLSWQGGWTDGKSYNDDDPAVLVVHGHTVPQKTSEHLTDPEAIWSVFSRMETNGRICVDGGSAIKHGVAAAVFTDDEVSVLFSPVPSKWSLPV